MSSATWILDGAFVFLVLLVPVTIAMAGEKLARVAADQEAPGDEG